MRQILLHPGFHKTGTSSIQHFLWHNRDVLAPHLTVILLRHLKPVVRDCARFSRFGNPADLINYVDDMDDACTQAGVAPDKNILVSCEGLLGHIPGWPNVADYSAAPTLLSYAAGYFAERFPDAQTRVVLTVREANAWLFSAYRHLLLRHRITDDFDTFAETYENAATFPKLIAEITQTLAPLPVQALPLWEIRDHPAGPGAAIADLVPLPTAVRGQLQPVGEGNAGPPRHLWQDFLAFNRSALPDDAVRLRKTALARQHNLGGWAEL